MQRARNLEQTPSLIDADVADVGGVLDVVRAGDGVITANQERGVVARITMPRRRIGRSRLTEGEAGELDEKEFPSKLLPLSQGRASEAAAGRGDREVRLTEGANHAVFRGGAGINRNRQTRTRREVVAIAIPLTQIAELRVLIVGSAVERGVDAQITTQLDAGVGTRNVEETGTIQGADPHVLDRFGLYGKISCLRPTHGEKTRR